MLPIIKTIIIQSNNVLRNIIDVKDVKIGAPNVTPKIYKDTVNPVVVKGILNSFAISGSNPTLMNSVVPIAKALTAKASNANVLPFFLLYYHLFFLLYKWKLSF